MLWSLKDMAVMRKWREHERNLQAFKNSAFDLIAHPDATPEQVMTVVIKAQAVQNAHYQIVNMMRKKGWPV